MKTYLEQCKAVCREAGLANGENACTTVINQIGQVGRIVEYVRQSWVEIQNRHQHTGMNWRWMRGEFVLTTAAGTDTYAYGSVNDKLTAAPITRFRNWMIKDYSNQPKCYRQSAGVGTEGWMSYLDWDDFRYLYRIGTQNQGQPIHITITPQNQIALGPVPDDIYIISGDYMKGAQFLMADGDIPEIPEAFEDAIMYMALSKFGIKHNVVEAVTAGEDGAATYLGALEGDQLSEIPIGSPLA